MQVPLKFQTLIDLFYESLEGIESLDKQCIEIDRIERQERLTYGQLNTKAQDFAVWLIQTKGLWPKDKVAIVGKNRVDWDIAFWGIILAGAVPVLIDPERPVEGVMNHIVHTDTRFIVLSDDYQDAESRQELKDFSVSWDSNLVEMTGRFFCGLPDAQGCMNPAVLERVSYKNLWGPCTLCPDRNSARVEKDELLNKIRTEIRADDTAVILCTSGTTGDPREVELTHANLICNIQGSVEKVKVTGEDRLGHILPPHHSFGLTVGKLLPFWVGATNIYTNRYRQIPELIRDREITIFVAIPALFSVLARNMEEALAREKKEKPHLRLLDRCFPRWAGKKMVKKLGWSNLRFFLSGAAAVPRWVLEVFWRRGLLLYEGYGTTENSPVYGFNNSAHKLGSVGRPITMLFVKIVNERDESLGPGEEGEICLGGPCIMKGYYKNPQATQAVIKTDRQGVRWLHTGDLGYLDKDGQLYITGRKKYLIVLPGGKKVNPELVELALSEAQYVKEILVVPGFRKDLAGDKQEAVKAIVHPAWDVIENNTRFSYSDLVKQPQVLKKLVWQSINECQQKSRRLSQFEKVSSQHLEIRIDEFQKTSSGKIKREVYIKV